MVLWSLGPFIVPSARAHDLYESWSNATIRATALELSVTMARATVLRLIDPAVTIRGLTAENFAAHRARLEQEAGELFVLTAGRNTPIAARRVTVELTEENDIAFKVVYPRPPPGRLHLHAAFLRKLGEGFGGILEVSDTEGHHLGWDQLSAAHPNLEVTVPAATPSKKNLRSQQDRALTVSNRAFG